MLILARSTKFLDFYDLRKAVATGFLGISKIPTVNFEIHPLSCCLLKILLSGDTDLCQENLNLG